MELGSTKLNLYNKKINIIIYIKLFILIFILITHFMVDKYINL